MHLPCNLGISACFLALLFLPDDEAPFLLYCLPALYLSQSAPCVPCFWYWSTDAPTPVAPTTAIPVRSQLLPLLCPPPHSACVRKVLPAGRSSCGSVFKLRVAAAEAGKFGTSWEAYMHLKSSSGQVSYLSPEKAVKYRRCRVRLWRFRRSPEG